MTRMRKRYLDCHGMDRDHAMKQRGRNGVGRTNERYGGRGIKVCDEWRNSSLAFITWALANGWKKGLHIDRIDNDGNYLPENCRFLSPAESARNKRSNRVIEFNGETLLMVEWSERLNIPYDALNQRINILKWPIERALTQPLRRKAVST